MVCYDWLGLEQSLFAGDETVANETGTFSDSHPELHSSSVYMAGGICSWTSTGRRRNVIFPAPPCSLGLRLFFVQPLLFSLGSGAGLRGGGEFKKRMQGVHFQGRIQGGRRWIKHPHPKTSEAMSEDRSQSVKGQSSLAKGCNLRGNREKLQYSGCGPAESMHSSVTLCVTK